MIPLFMTFLLKKAIWADRGVSFDVSGTYIFRTIVKDLMNHLKKSCGAEEILNEEDIIQELTTKFFIRVNDHEPTEFEGNKKELKIDFKDNSVNALSRKSRNTVNIMQKEELPDHTKKFESKNA